MEILMVRLATYFQNRNLPCVALENVFFGLPKYTRLEIARQFTTREGPYLSKIIPYEFTPYHQALLGSLRSLFCLHPHMQIIEGGYISKMDVGIPTTMIYRYKIQCRQWREQFKHAIVTNWPDIKIEYENMQHGNR